MDDSIIRQFESREIRSVWNADEEEWYFSVVDVVGALTESVDPKQYIKRLRSRDAELNDRWGTICTPTRMVASDGKSYKTNAATVQGILRIIQSIPSKKAEPFKQWLAQVGAERIDETIDPEKAIDRALKTYLRKGYDPDWIHQRLMAIRVRNELTDEWDERGVQPGREYAILTDEIYKAWAGMSAREYEDFKGLTKENLRDNMSAQEIVLNMLAETSTALISQTEQPETLEDSKRVAREGGTVAGNARRELEARTAKPIVTSMNAIDFARLLGYVEATVDGLPGDGDEPS